MKYMACLKATATKQSWSQFTKSTSEENDIDNYQMEMIQAWFVSQLETFNGEASGFLTRDSICGEHKGEVGLQEQFMQTTNQSYWYKAVIEQQQKPEEQ